MLDNVYALQLVRHRYSRTNDEPLDDGTPRFSLCLDACYLARASRDTNVEVLLGCETHELPP